MPKWFGKDEVDALDAEGKPPEDESDFSKADGDHDGILSQAEFQRYKDREAGLSVLQKTANFESTGQPSAHNANVSYDAPSVMPNANLPYDAPAAKQTAGQTATSNAQMYEYASPEHFFGSAAVKVESFDGFAGEAPGVLDI